MKIWILVLSVAALSGCSTQYVVRLTATNSSVDVLDISGVCLREMGFKRYTEQNEQWQRDGDFQSMRQDPTLKDIWHGERMYVGIHQLPDEWRVRLVATTSYDEFAQRAREAYMSCIGKHAPQLHIAMEAITGVDFR